MATAKRQNMWHAADADHDGLSPEAWAHVRAMEDAREREEARGADLAALGIYGRQTTGIPTLDDCWGANPGWDDWDDEWDEEEEEEEQQTPEQELGLTVFDAADVWPDWSGVERCRCGLHLDRMAKDNWGLQPDKCPSCDLELVRLVCEHCQHCGQPLLRRYVVDADGDAFCDYDCALRGARELVTAAYGEELYVVS